MRSTKSFLTPSSKPVDVEYRVKRARQTLAQLVVFVASIDASGFAAADHAAATSALASLETSLAGLDAARPTKKPRPAKKPAVVKAKTKRVATPKVASTPAPVTADSELGRKIAAAKKRREARPAAATA